MNRFRSLLLDIGQGLTRDELNQLKFACRDFIPAGKAEFITRPHELFLELERLDRLDDSHRDALAKMLVDIGRSDLRNKLLQIKDDPPPEQHQQAHPGQNTPPRQHHQKMTHTFLLETEIAIRISTNWKFLGRYLGLPDYVIRNIEDTYKGTEEKASQMLTKWLQSSKDTSAHALMGALDRIGRRDLAEVIEEKLASTEERVDNGPRENTYPAGGGPFPNMGELQQHLPNVENHDGPHNAVPREQQEYSQETHTSPVTRTPVQASDDPEGLNKPGTFFDEALYLNADFLGRGGFASVYCLLDKRTQMKYAVKSVDLGENDPLTKEKVKALQEEIRLLQVLKNPHIVKYFKTELHHNFLALFMEYMPGNSIAKKISQHGCIDEESVRKYTCQLLKGIKYLHENRVIHRDIKGANILLDESHKHVKLTDFGIAFALQGIATSTGHCVTNQQGLVASIYWTSPELLSSQPYSFNTDIWSLGCTIVEMLTGNPPLRDGETIVVQAMYKIISCSIEPPEECSSLAKEFLDQCFKKQSERPAASFLVISEFPISSS